MTLCKAFTLSSKTLSLQLSWLIITNFVQKFGFGIAFRRNSTGDLVTAADNFRSNRSRSLKGTVAVHSGLPVGGPPGCVREHRQVRLGGGPREGIVQLERLPIARFTIGECNEHERTPASHESRNIAFTADLVRTDRSLALGDCLIVPGDFGPQDAMNKSLQILQHHELAIQCDALHGQLSEVVHARPQRKCRTADTQGAWIRIDHTRGTVT